MKDLGRSAHGDRLTRAAIACWPRLMDIHLAAAYLSVGESTIRDYIADRILQSVELPGSTLRDKNGAIVAHSKARKISKILIDKADLDALIDEKKSEDRGNPGGPTPSQSHAAMEETSSHAKPAGGLMRKI